MFSNAYDPQDHVYEDVRKHRRHLLRWSLIGLATLALLWWLLPAGWLLARQGVHERSVNQAATYLTRSLVSPNALTSAHKAVLAYDWRAATLPAPWHILTFFAAIGFMFIGGKLRNPHPNIPWIFGRARYATDEDIKAMEKRGQVGLFGGKMMALGRWAGGKDGRGKYGTGKILQLLETLTVTCFAPPGAGKTASLVVPTIVTADAVTQIIHDCKPELWAITSGHRSKVSTCLMLAWGKMDDPAKGIFYARFNPISEKILPPLSDPNLNTIIDALAKIIIPDPEGASGNASYFINKGRAALVGLVIFLLYKINREKDYSGISERWQGREASLPMLLDFMAVGLYEAERRRQATADAQQDPTAAMRMSMKDPLSEWFKELAHEARTRNYDMRAFMELTNLSNMAREERSGVLGQFDSELTVFKNPAVAERTSGCDFSMEDLRGMLDPVTNTVKPLSVYIVVNQAEAPAFGKITALFCDIASRTLLSYGPGELSRQGKKLGPYPTLFVLDEFPKLSKSEAIIDGPDLGRSKAVSYLIITQSLAQIKLTYSNDKLDNLITTSSVNVIMPLNDADTAKKFVEMVGPTTIKKTSVSRRRGMSKEVISLSTNVSESYERVDLLTTGDLTGLQPGKQMVLVQNFKQRPIYLDAIRYWEDPLIAPRCYNFKAKTGVPEAAPMPDWMRERRIAEYEEQLDRLRQLRLQQAEAAE